MTLHEISKILFSEKEDITTIEKALGAYRSLLTEISSLNLDVLEHKKDLDFENGIAIGTTWAAMCLDDALRTKRFVRGLHLAIESLRKKKQEPIHVLYAGTGPYATLLLPILAHYSVNEVQASLLEINATSLENVKRVIQQLGLEEQIIAYHLEDGTSFQVPAADTIDILISETMQHALQKEQQVPIVYNLVPQLREDALLLPEKICLEIAIISMEELSSQKKNQPVLGKVFELSKLEVLHDLKDKHSTGLQSLQPRTLSLDQFQLTGSKHDLLVILTTIHVFEDQVLNTNESGLTAPKIICPIDETFSYETIVTTGYRIGKENELWVEVR